MQKALNYAAPLLLLFATQAFGQVHVDVLLEKDRYLEGEPVVVVVNILNIGDESVGYSACDGNVNLTAIGAERRGRSGETPVSTTAPAYSSPAAGRRRAR